MPDVQVGIHCGDTMTTSATVYIPMDLHTALFKLAQWEQDAPVPLGEETIRNITKLEQSLFERYGVGGLYCIALDPDGFLIAIDRAGFVVFLLGS